MNPEILTIRRNEKYEIVLVVLLLFVSCSFVILNDYVSSGVTIGLWILTMLLVCVNQKLVVEKNIFLVTFLIIILMAISDVCNGENIRTTICNSIVIVVAFMYVSTRKFDEFRRAFIGALKFLCIISLIGYVIFLLIPSLSQYAIWGHRNFNCLILFNHCANLTLSDAKRNFGMFWEPGAFQTFINIALLLEVSGEHPSRKNIVIFILTTITTFSTTGYIAMGVILLYPFLDTKNNADEGRRTRNIIIIIILIMIFIVFRNHDLFFSASKITVFGKLNELFEGISSGSNKVTSGSIRYYAIVKPLEAFFEKPILGYGYEGLKEATYSYTYSMNTCTFVNWFAVHGLFYGVLMIIGAWKCSRIIGKDIKKTILVMIIFFLVTCAENYVDNASLMVFFLYGFSAFGIREVNYEDILY